MALPNEDALKKALEHFNDARQEHEEFVTKVEERYKTYRGILEVDSNAAQWTSKSHPPYIMHIVETSLASMIEPKLAFKIRPTPSIGFLADPDAAQRAVEGADAHQRLFDWQNQQDGFNEIQRPFILQNAIAGLTVAKTSWAHREERRRKMEPVETPLEAPDGTSLINPDGSPIMTTTLKEKVVNDVIYDGPTTEVRDVRDFLWTPNATSLQTSPYIIDRVWKTPEEVRRGFRDGGAYGESRGGWSQKVCDDLLKESKDFTEDIVSREQMLFNIERTKGLVEVLEVWDRQTKTVTVIANRCVLLSHRTNFPFFHESYPFTVCSTQPDLFRIPGISQVEKIAHLQTLLWDITNQSLDNLRFINNAIAMFRPDVPDIDAYEWYPGARWLLEDPKQVEMWSPNPIPAEVSIGREALIKGDMQNLAGGFPFSSGTDSQYVDQKTATGASIVSNIAQRSFDLSKQQLYIAYANICRQRLVLNQQFMREPTVAPVTGLDGKQALMVILPELLTGDYQLDHEVLPDAMMKQEEQAAAGALLTMALQAFPVFMAAAQNGGATPLNLDAFMEEFIKSHGKEDFARFFSKTTPVMAAPSPGGMAPPGAPPPGAPPAGITGSGSIDPAVSPSNTMSLSPLRNMQRAMAQDRS